MFKRTTDLNPLISHHIIYHTIS